MNKLDLRLAYKADTGFYPIHKEENSLREFEWDFELGNHAKPDNEEAFEIESEAQETLGNAKSWTKDILEYVEWLEDKLIEKSNKKRRTK